MHLAYTGLPLYSSGASHIYIHTSRLFIDWTRRSSSHAMCSPRSCILSHSLVHNHSDVYRSTLLPEFGLDLEPWAVDVSAVAVALLAKQAE